MKMTEVRKALVKLGNDELLQMFDNTLKTDELMKQVQLKLLVNKFLWLPQVQTAVQVKNGTRVWKTKRGLYSVNPARNRPGWYARFWPYMRGCKEKLSSTADRAVLGCFSTEDEAVTRCAEHIKRNGNKPLKKQTWSGYLRMKRRKHVA